MTDPPTRLAAALAERYRELLMPWVERERLEPPANWPGLPARDQ